MLQVWICILHLILKIYQQIELTESQQKRFATNAMKLRFGEDRPQMPITTTQALEIHRKGDDKNDLWTVFNRLQENLVKGGIKGKSASGRQITTRKLDGAYSELTFNIALWGMMAKYAKHEAK